MFAVGVGQVGRGPPFVGPVAVMVLVDCRVAVGVAFVGQQVADLLARVVLAVGPFVFAVTLPKVAALGLEVVKSPSQLVRVIPDAAFDFVLARVTVLVASPLVAYGATDHLGDKKDPRH